MIFSIFWVDECSRLNVYQDIQVATERATAPHEMLLEIVPDCNRSHKVSFLFSVTLLMTLKSWHKTKICNIRDEHVIFILSATFNPISLALCTLSEILVLIK